MLRRGNCAQTDTLNGEPAIAMTDSLRYPFDRRPGVRIRSLLRSAACNLDIASAEFMPGLALRIHTVTSTGSEAIENDDHNPPRIAPRHLFDLAVGDDNLFRGDRYKWNVRFIVINLTNDDVLYNFLSTFSGTHYVTPRTYTAQLGFTF